MSQVPLFAELCAGLASVSLRLQGGPYCRPPVSRMGSKQGYAGAVLEVLGLRSGQGAASYLWAEPDDGCRALLQAYPQPDVLREAADIIRSWADEDPRALWERLRAEGPIRGASGGEVARWSRLVVTSRAGNPVLGFQRAGTPRDGGPNYGPTTPADRLESVAASEIARWARIVTGNRPLVTVCADARTLSPDGLPQGTVAYLDPPYQGTTGYDADLARDEVLALALRWHEAGHTVCISEAEPLAALEGWHHVEITSARVGQARTFSSQKREWLTLNRPPAWLPRTTLDLFA